VKWLQVYATIVTVRGILLAIVKMVVVEAVAAVATTAAKAMAVTVATVVAISDVIVKNATNAIKWGILHANARKTLIDATDAMVLVTLLAIAANHQMIHAATIVTKLDT